MFNLLAILWEGNFISKNPTLKIQKVHKLCTILFYILYKMLEIHIIFSYGKFKNILVFTTNNYISFAPTSKLKFNLKSRQ